MKKQFSNFRHNWVLADKLLVGEAPHKLENINLLKRYGINSILCLCDEKEFPTSNEIKKSFNFIRIVLPDHKHDRSITFKEIEDSISTLVNLLEGGKVYVHCYAGLERSPLICMGYLIYKKNLNLVESLEYIMSINPGSSPMQNNLNQLENYFLRKVNIVNSDNEI